MTSFAGFTASVIRLQRLSESHSWRELLNPQAPCAVRATGRRTKLIWRRPTLHAAIPADTQGGNPGIDLEARVGHSLTIDLQRTHLKNAKAEQVTASTGKRSAMKVARRVWRERPQGLTYPYKRADKVSPRW